MNSRELGELLDRVSREDRRALIEEEAARQLARRQADQPEQPRPPAPKRSQMSPRDKSQYIQKHGLERYNRLDWE